MQSINQRLRIIVVAFLATYLLLTTTYCMWAAFTEQKLTSLRHQRDVAGLVAGAVDSHLQCVEREMFSAFHGHEYAQLSLERRRSILADLFSRHENMVSLAYLDENKKELIRIAAGSATPQAVSGACGDYDNLSLNRQKESRFCLRESSDDRLVSIITPAIPLFEEWNGGILVANLSLHDITIFNEAEREPALTLYVVDDEGRMVTHGFSGKINTDKIAAIDAHERSGEIRLDDGQKVLRAVVEKRYNGLTLNFIVQKPVDQILHETVGAGIMILPAFLISGAVILLGAMAAVGKVLAPLGTLRDEARLLHDGGEGQNLPLGATGEVGELAGVINDLANALRESNAAREYESLERKKNENQAAIYRAFLQASLDFCDDMIVYKDEKGRYLGCNEAAEKFFGVMGGEMPCDGLGAVLGGMDQRVLQSKSVQFCEHEVQISDGRTLLLKTSTFPVYTSGGEILGLIGVSRDISTSRGQEEELSRLRERIGSLERKGVVGTFAAGVAHDFNNLLGAILGYTEMVMEEQPMESQARKDLQNVMDAGMKAKGLVSQILAFARGTGDEGILMCPLSLVKEFVKEFGKGLPESIDLEVDIDPDCPMIVIDPSQLHKLLTDLCGAARRGIGEQNGLLRVAMRGGSLSDEDLRRQPEARDREYVKLDVDYKVLFLKNGERLQPHM
ncbi:MAG: PAS domain S-box protein, partial [Desulfobulbaceae bacterium]|nr:PAS domain S-box protein [Desulfobulbaceae bacterium]